MKVILASSSKNRKELLDRMGFSYDIAHPTYEENIIEEKSPQNQVEEFSLGKARSVLDKFKKTDDVLIMGFDSMIEFEGTSVGKPKTKKAAFEMIQKFIGKPQTMVTGVAVLGYVKGKYFEKVDSEETKVVFRKNVTNCQIRSFLDFGDWQGKCGAYSVLGTGIFFLEKIEGDFLNVVGIPVIKLGKMITEVTGKRIFSVITKN